MIPEHFQWTVGQFAGTRSLQIAAQLQVHTRVGASACLIVEASVPPGITGVHEPLLRGAGLLHAAAIICTGIPFVLGLGFS
jgi:hypothetical protein